MSMTGRRTLLFLRLLLGCTLLSLALASSVSFAQTGGELRFCLRSEPKTFDPALVDDDASLSIRYLTGGVLARVSPCMLPVLPLVFTRADRPFVSTGLGRAAVVQSRLVCLSAQS